MPSDQSGFKFVSIRVAVLLPALLLAALAMPANAVDGASVARGGRLYDNWYLESRESPPVVVHPSYRYDSLTMDTVADSWRCVFCHGWDYLGSDAQGTGSLARDGGLDAATLSKVLNNANHAYGERLTPADIADLVAFVNDGTVEMERHVERDSNRLSWHADRE